MVVAVSRLSGPITLLSRKTCMNLILNTRKITTPQASNVLMLTDHTRKKIADGQQWKNSIEIVAIVATLLTKVAQ